MKPRNSVTRLIFFPIKEISFDLPVVLQTSAWLKENTHILGMRGVVCLLAFYYIVRGSLFVQQANT